MINPWIKKFGTPLQDLNGIKHYCLDSELEIINEFNKTQKPEYKIHTNIYPAAYSANIDKADIIILVSNPGYDKSEDENGDYLDSNRIQNNLEVLTEFRKKDDFTVGYWNQKLKQLSDIHTPKVVNEKVAILQYFPYHSEKFKPIGKKLMGKFFPNQKYLPSQEYTFHKLEQAVKRNALIICTRSEDLWLDVINSFNFNIPHNNFLTTINKRNPTISIGNLTNKENDWELIKNRFQTIKIEDTLLLSVGVEGGGAEIYKTKEGLYKKNEIIYPTFKASVDDLGSDLLGTTPLFIDKDLREELTEIFNSWLKTGVKSWPHSIRSWEIWLNKRFYSQFNKVEYQEFKLENIFGDDHLELFSIIDKFLHQYVHFQNLIDFLKPDNSELQILLKQYNFPGMIFLEYCEKLLGWCIDNNNERFDSVLGYGEDELSKIESDKKIFIDQTINGLFFDKETNKREISFTDFSVVIKESSFINVKQGLINQHLKHSNDNLKLISGQKIGAFSLFKPKLSGIISNDKVYDYESRLGKSSVFSGVHLFVEAPSQEMYIITNDDHRIWRDLFYCFNKTISYGCLYDALEKEGFSKNESLELSGLASDTHLKLSQLLRKKYVINDEE